MTWTHSSRLIAALLLTLALALGQTLPAAAQRCWNQNRRAVTTLNAAGS